jgi:glycerol dehydrogenase
LDTEVIQKAPYRFLVAGIGDTLAKWFESRATVQRFRKNAINGSALSLAQHLYDLLLRAGCPALEAVQAGKTCPELEDVIDGIILVSGSVSGYGGDDCRTAAAHAVYSGLTIFPEVHQTYHGEIVAFGILTQLAIEDKTDAEILELIEFYRQVKLPFTLKALGIDKNQLTASQWEELGKVTVAIEDMANMPFKVTPRMVIDGIQRADSLGEQ